MQRIGRICQHFDRERAAGDDDQWADETCPLSDSEMRSDLGARDGGQPHR